MKYLYLISLLGVSLLQCKVSSPSNSIEDPSVLLGTWIHSFEEDSSDVRFYRKPSFNFAPSRGRERFFLEEAGTLGFTPIAPNDQPITYPGKWHLEGHNLVFEFNESKKDYIIIQSNTSILKLKLK